MFHFFFDRNQLMPFTDTDTEQPCKCRNHLFCIFIFPVFTHPCNRIQCIIQEMWINLGFQSTNFRILLILLCFCHFPDQFPYFHCHFIKVIRDRTNLIKRLNRNQNIQISLLYFLHSLHNRFYGCIHISYCIDNQNKSKA